MRRHLGFVLARPVLLASAVVTASGYVAEAQLAYPPPQNKPSPSQAAAAPASSSNELEVTLLRALQANPYTAPFAFKVERRGNRLSLRGRVGSKMIHDAAMRTAIALNIPVIDDLVIDTLAAHQAAASYPPAMAGGGAGYGYASPLAGYPSAGAVGPLPYTYPQPLFGRLDDPFYGFEPPVISYPPWWGALSANRLGPPPSQNAGLNPNAVAQGSANSVNPPNAGQAGQPQGLELPYGTIDMTLDSRGVATLRGDVPSLAERLTLGQKIAQTPGVTQVVNLLNVKPGLAKAVQAANDQPPPPPVPAVPGVAADQPAQPAANQVAPQAQAVVEADPVGVRATRSAMAKLGSGGGTLKIRVKEGVAQLSGKVPTIVEAMQVFRAVQKTPGVERIDDRLEFTLPDGSAPNPLADKGDPDDVEPYLEAQLKRQMGDLAHVDRVRMRGDNLTIKGTLAREEDRPRLEAILRSMPLLRGFRVAAEFGAEAQ